MKYLVVLSLCFAFSYASITHAETRSNQILNNRTPKRNQTNVWDMIMVRGSNGQLQSWSDHMASMNEVSDSAVCTDCQIVVRALETAVKEGEKLEQFKSALKLLCNLLSSDEQEACRNIVDNLDVILRRLDPLLSNPRLLCQELSLCGPARVPRVVRLLVRWLAARTEGPIAASDVVCDECMFVVAELKTIISEKSTQDQVRQMFDQLCNYLGGETAQRCVSIIDQYFPLLWDELEALMSDSRGLCIDLELCANRQALASHTVRRTSMLRLLPAIRRRLPMSNEDLHASLVSRGTPRLDSAARFMQRIQTRDGIQTGCILCKIGFSGLIAWLKTDPQALPMMSNTTRQLVCHKIIPAELSPGCDDFFQLYLQSVLYMTVEEIGNQPVCQMIHACKTVDARKLDEMTEVERAHILCQACTLVAEYAQHEINDRSVQDDLTHVVEQACDDLPEEMRQDCKSLVETYGPAIFQSLAENLNPMTICPALHMCPSRTLPMKEIKEVVEN